MALSPKKITGGERDGALLRAANLRVRYRNGALGIDDVSFTVQHGAVIALFGPNGAGKTTTVRAVCGFLRTEGARLIRGSVVFRGIDITNAEPHRAARLGIAFSPERDKIFPQLTVRENLEAFGRRPHGARARGLLDEVHQLFPIIAERAKQQAGRLSGGQRQMLALSRCILQEPKLLVVDEMTLGLHHSLHEPLFRAVRHVAEQGTSVVLVDESAAFALDIADYCYILRAGRVRHQGAAESFRDGQFLAAGYVGSP